MIKVRRWLDGSSLVGKVTLLFLVMGILPALAVGLFANYQASQNIEKEIVGALEMYAELTEMEWWSISARSRRKPIS